MNNKALKKTMSSAELSELTPRNIARILLDIMKNHIGTINEIDQDDLFKQIFGHYYNDDGIRDYLRWDIIRNAMHYCRKYTKCFIASRYTSKNSGWSYFVVSNAADASEYQSMLEKNIKSMKYMQKRAQKAAVEKWHEQEWTLPEYGKGVVE